MGVKSFAGRLAPIWKPYSVIQCEACRLNPSKISNSFNPCRSATASTSATGRASSARIQPDHFKPAQTPIEKSRQPRTTSQQDRVSISKQATKTLLQKLARDGSSPLKLLQKDGDWSKEEFWAAVDFLKQASRFKEIPEVFDAWTSLERSRADDFNYTKIISVFCEVGLVEEAVLALQEMKGHQYCTAPSLEAYNSIIHGYANKGQFDEALIYLDGMEDVGLKPDGVTFDGLIEAYGKFHKFDEMMKCLDTMKSHECPPDHVTYNLLIQGLARGGLLSKMERTCQALHSKKLHLQTATLMAVIEAYASFGLVEKMEDLYLKGVKSKRTFPTVELVRKLAKVYIENHMFSRLDDLAGDVCSVVGKTRFAWNLKLLSHASSLSKKGMNYVLEEMLDAGVEWNVTVVNILLLAQLKMKDLKQFNYIIRQMPGRNIIPDIVTFGALYDAYMSGFDWSRVLMTWRMYRYLDRYVGMNTDPLALVAFGKGHFLTSLEEIYSSLESRAQKEKRWTYQSLMDFVLEHNRTRTVSQEDA